MSRRLAVLFLFVSTTLLPAQEQWEPPAHQPAPADIPRIRFQAFPNFISPLKTPPPLYMGEVADVATDSKGNVYVANRGAHPLLEFDSNGNFLREIGEGDILLLDACTESHGVKVDAEDNIWFTDAGCTLVTKYDQGGRVVLNVGRRKSPPEYTPRKTDVGETSRTDRAERNPTDKLETFIRPTNVAFGSNGVFFATDGYGSFQIAKFDKNGDWIKTWGEPGTGQGEFEVPHMIAVDAKGLLYVADRENKRIQVFDQDGKYLKEWDRIGGGTGAYPWSICFTNPPNQVMYVADGYHGHVWKMDLDGKVLGVLGEFGRAPGEFNHAHSIACGGSIPNNVIYVGETRTRRVQKLVIEPTN